MADTMTVIPGQMDSTDMALTCITRQFGSQLGVASSSVAVFAAGFMLGKKPRQALDILVM
eukprot:4293963-Amphidinium_carterae.1